MADPQVGARNMLLHLDLPGRGDFRVLGNPVKLSDLAARAPTVPPLLGEHTGQVLESLGYTQIEIDAITEANAA
jgi:crotonobetainyl-CoA:carnitine CoA-transferase CaiB-like acyl-CoA transferase